MMVADFVFIDGLRAYIRFEPRPALLHVRLERRRVSNPRVVDWAAAYRNTRALPVRIIARRCPVAKPATVPLDSRET